MSSSSTSPRGRTLSPNALKRQHIAGEEGGSLRDVSQSTSAVLLAVQGVDWAYLVDAAREARVTPDAVARQNPYVWSFARRRALEWLSAAALVVNPDIQAETYFRAVHLFDRLCARAALPKNDLQAYAAFCLSFAEKFEEVDAFLDYSQLLRICGRRRTAAERAKLQGLEESALRFLDFNVARGRTPWFFFHSWCALRGDVTKRSHIADVDCVLTFWSTTNAWLAHGLDAIQRASAGVLMALVDTADALQRCLVVNADTKSPRFAPPATDASWHVPLSTLQPLAEELARARAECAYEATRPIVRQAQVRISRCVEALRVWSAENPLHAAAIGDEHDDVDMAPR